MFPKDGTNFLQLMNLNVSQIFNLQHDLVLVVDVLQVVLGVLVLVKHVDD